MRVIKATSMNIGSKLNQARTRPTMSPAGPGRGERGCGLASSHDSKLTLVIENVGQGDRHLDRT